MRWLTLLGSLLLSSTTSAATVTVGPGADYATLREALANAADNDIIEIAAGAYPGDGGRVSQDNLTIRGVGGLAHLDATGAAIEGSKGILVVSGTGVTIEDLELSNAAVSANDGCNGAGIRLEGGDFTARRIYAHDNENGILGTPVGNASNQNVTIESSRFERNGSINTGGGCQGQSHGIYINGFARLTVRFSTFSRANFGHELKTRARENFILYNRFANEDGNNGSREIELTEGGLAVVIGNVIQQTPSGANSQMLAFAMEAALPPMELYVVNNTFVNERGSGTHIFTGRPGASGLVGNNYFVGGGTRIDGQANTLLEQSNTTTNNPGFVDRAAGDYHLQVGAAAVNSGSSLGMGGGISLTPTVQHVAPTGSEPRPQDGDIDIGAFEFAAAAPDAGMPPDTGPADVGGPSDAADTGPSDNGITEGRPVDDLSWFDAARDTGVPVDTGSVPDAGSVDRDAGSMDAELGDAAAQDAGGKDDNDGCSAVNTDSSFVLCLLALLMWRVRRRRH